MVSASAAKACSPPFSDDILEGADEIAEFVYGTRGKRRVIYNLIEKHGFPVFRLGAKIHARKSTILGWIAKQEGQAAGDGP